MKTMILAAAAVLSLGVGAAFAQGVPAGGYTMPHYGSGAFETHRTTGQSADAQNGGQSQSGAHSDRSGG